MRRDVVVNVPAKDNVQIFLAGYYGFRNTGDEAVLAVALADLRDNLPNARFTVMSGNPAETSARHGVPAVAWDDPAKIIEAIEQSRLVIIGGGGLFHDYWGVETSRIFAPGNWGIGLFAGIALHAALRSKRVMLYGVGVGPLFSEEAREYTRAVCLAADVITVRDRNSKHTVESLGIPGKAITVTADCAFAGRPAPAGGDELAAFLPSRTGAEPRVAVAVREWNAGVHPEFWQKQLAKALDGLVEKTGAKVVFIPFQKTGNEREDDVAAGQRVASLMRRAASVTAIEESKEPEEIEALISQCDLVVGMRFHSIIFAARSAVPVVSLSYDPKVEALMDEIGLGYLNTRLDRIESRKLFGSMMTALEQRGEISALLRTACGDLAGRAKQTARLAKNLAEKKRHVPKKPLPDVLFKVSLGIQDQLAVIDQLEEQRRTLDARVVELAAWAQKQQEQIESLRSELSAKDSETAKLASRLHASSELLREADQARLEARRDLEKHLAEVERDLAGARAQAQDAAAEAADLRNQAEELQHWTSRQENHVKDLTAWAASQKSQIDRLTSELAAARLRSEALAPQLARAKDEVEFLDKQASYYRRRLHNARSTVTLRRWLHSVLDAVQGMTPEWLRSRIRPSYLKLYKWCYPAGKTEFDIFEVETHFSPGRYGDSSFHSRLPLIPRYNRMASDDLTLSAGSSFDFYPSYRPKVSVILPVWNQARLLGDAIASVLGQSYANIELIVVDDGSTEDLAPVLERFSHDDRLQVIRKNHAGLPRALNAGFRAATGDFLTWTSADNLMRPEMVATLLDFLLWHPNVDMTYGNVDLIGEDGEPLVGSAHRPFNQRPGATNEILLPHTVETLGRLDDNFIGAAFLFRSRIYAIAGDHDTTLLGTEDYDYWLRINSLGSIRHVDTEESLYSYRLHEGSLSTKHGSEEIPANVQTLMNYHRRREDFYHHPCEVVIVYDARPEVPEPFITALGSAFRKLGHAVHVVATGKWESDSPPIGCRLIREADAEAACRRVLKADGEAKQLVVSFASDTALTERLSSDFSPAHLQCFQWFTEPPPSDTPAVPVSNGSPAPGASRSPRGLAASASVAASLNATPGVGGSLCIPSTFCYSAERSLILKARDNVYPLWDFPNVSSELVVCIGPTAEDMLAIEGIAECLAKHRRLDFLFIGAGASSAADPRSYLGELPNLYYLGHKPFRDWHIYLSRASLLFAPFRNEPHVLPWIQDTLTCYLLAGKPILATAAAAEAGFTDMPNALLCDERRLGEKLPEATEILPNLSTADEYLARRSASGLARNLAATANSKLFFEATRGGTHHEEERITPQTIVKPSLPGPVNGQPRVLLETQTLHRGGLECVVASMAKTLTGAGFHCDIAVTKVAGDIAGECKQARLPTYDLSENGTTFDSLIEHGKPNLLIAHYSNEGAPLAAKRGVPVLSVIHNSYVWHSAEQDEEVRAVDRFVTKYIAVSKSAGSYFCRKYGIPRSKVVPVPNGVDLEVMKQRDARPPSVTRKSLGIPSDAYVFVQVAAFFGTKGQLHSARAMREIVKEFPDLRLLLVGQAADVKYRDLVRKYVRDEGLENNVHFCGQSDAVADYYRLADAFLAPSLMEGWSLAVNEAMYFRLPMILTAVGSTEEVIDGEDIGIVVPPAYDDVMSLRTENLWSVCTNSEPDNLRELVDAMRRFQLEKAAWTKRGSLGREKVIQHLDSKAIGARYVELVRQIVTLPSTTVH